MKLYICRWLHFQMFHDLIKADAFPKFQTDQEKLMLNTAADRGYTDIVRILKKMGASVYEKGPFKNSCLHLCSEKGHLETVLELLAW